MQMNLMVKQQWHLMEVPGQGTANRTASHGFPNDTVAVRDGSGDLFASNFRTAPKGKLC